MSMTNAHGVLYVDVKMQSSEKFNVCLLTNEGATARGYSDTQNLELLQMKGMPDYFKSSLNNL